jgi:hypothetical protein
VCLIARLGSGDWLVFGFRFVPLVAGLCRRLLRGKGKKRATSRAAVERPGLSHAPAYRRATDSRAPARLA